LTPPLLSHSPMTTNHPSNDMEDRKLLKLAAKAHGYVDNAEDNSAAFGLRKSTDGEFYWIDRNGRTSWNPADDDGQALRLAVKLRLHVDLQWSSVEAWDMRPSPKAFSEELDPDPCAATRRAIVRAAASIGENQ
jgi:hypothetical protein